MNLSETVKLECCTTNLKSTTKNESLKEISKILVESSEIDDSKLDDLYEALKNREEMGSTGFGKAIAIPHCQIDGIKDFVISLAVAKKGVNFDSIDKKKTKLFITIVGPTEKKNQHLKLLAKVSQTLKEPGLVENLVKVNSKINLYEEFIRNADNGIGEISKREQDKLMLMIVKDEDIIEDITEVFVEIGIQESTIIETQQMENLLSNIPLFMGFFDFTGGKKPYSKIIMLKIPKNYINAVIKGIEATTGDLDNYTGLNILVLDLFYSKGF